MRLFCWECKKSVSSELGDDAVIRAVCVCPECIEAGLVTFPKRKTETEVAIRPIEGWKCPNCLGPMVARTNRQNGEKFWGCKKYPDCKGTRDSMGLSREERDAQREAERNNKEDRHFEVSHQEGFPFGRR